VPVFSFTTLHLQKPSCAEEQAINCYTRLRVVRK